MHTLNHWTPLLLAPMLLTAALSAQAFSDENAEAKEVAKAVADRRAAARVVVPDPAGVPRRVVWVPPSPKRLDGFRPWTADEALPTADHTLRLAAASSAASGILAKSR
ncbi:hypothetical protein [Roseateles sp. BYS87W]|uniref:Uncharacterized protein n=1 Tax=Pelomonas baiyunensis TaxID=3299026 RepID=A0ABW7GWH3_9BURK